MKKNRETVLLVTSEFPPLPGGIGNHAFNLARQLSQKGYRVSIHTNARGSSDEQTIFDKENDLDVLRVARSSLQVFTIFRRIFTYLKCLNGLSKDGIVLVSGKFSIWMTGVLSLFLKRPIVAVLHGVEVNLQQPLLKRFTYWCLRRFDLLIAVSSYTREVMLSHAPKLKIQVINNGFEADRFEDASSDRPLIKGMPALITVGRLTRRKGQQNVIKALQRVKTRFPDVHYHMVGIDAEKQTFERLASKEGVLDHITFHGSVTNQKVGQLLSGSDIFCMLSEQDHRGDFEGFGIAIIEANYFGLPAIGAMNSGIMDAIEDGKSGALVQSGEREEFTQALEGIMKNYAFFSKNAKKWAQKFRWEKVVKQYIAHIKRLP